MRRSPQLFVPLLKESLFIECIAGSHLEAKGLSVELHFAAAEEQDVHGSFDALTVVVECLVFDQEVDAAMLDQVLARRVLQSEENRVISLNLAYAGLSLDNLASLHMR